MGNRRTGLRWQRDSTTHRYIEIAPSSVTFGASFPPRGSLRALQRNSFFREEKVLQKGSPDSRKLKLQGGPPSEGVFLNGSQQVYSGGGAQGGVFLGKTEAHRVGHLAEEF